MLKKIKNIYILLSTTFLAFIYNTTVTRGATLIEKIKSDKAKKMLEFYKDNYSNIWNTAFRNLLLGATNIISSITNLISVVISQFISMQWFKPLVSELQQVFNQFRPIFMLVFTVSVLITLVRAMAGSNGVRNLKNLPLRFLLFILFSTNVFVIPTILANMNIKTENSSEMGTTILAANTYDVFVRNKGGKIDHIQEHKCDESKQKNYMDDVSGEIENFNTTEEYKKICDINEKISLDLLNKYIIQDNGKYEFGNSDLYKAPFDIQKDQYWRYSIDYKSYFISSIIVLIALLYMARSIIFLFLEGIILSVQGLATLSSSDDLDKSKNVFSGLLQNYALFIPAIFIFIIFGSIYPDMVAKAENKFLTQIILSILFLILAQKMNKATEKVVNSVGNSIRNARQRVKVGNEKVKGTHSNLKDKSAVYNGVTSKIASNPINRNLESRRKIKDHNIASSQKVREAENNLKNSAEYKAATKDQRKNMLSRARTKALQDYAKQKDVAKDLRSTNFVKSDGKKFTGKESLGSRKTALSSVVADELNSIQKAEVQKAKEAKEEKQSNINSKREQFKQVDQEQMRQNKEKLRRQEIGRQIQIRNEKIKQTQDQAEKQLLQREKQELISKVNIQSKVESKAPEPNPKLESIKINSNPKGDLND